MRRAASLAVIPLLLAVLSCAPRGHWNPADENYDPATDPNNSQELPPIRPTDLVATAVTDRSVTLGWRDNSEYEDEFIVYRRLGTSGDFAAITPHVASPATSYTDSGLSPETTYTYYVVASSSTTGASQASNQLSVQTTSRVGPETPANLQVTASTESTISLGWDEVAGADGYRVYRSDAEAGSYVLQADEIELTEWSDSGLSAETTYWYTVSAYNADGESPQSSPVSGTTTAASAAAPATPSNLHVTAGTASAISLAWDAVSGAEGYRVYRSDTQTGTYLLRQDSIAQTAWTDSGLPAGTLYWYTVSAYNTQGESPQSSPVAGVTIPATPANLHVTATSASSISLAWDAVSGAGWYRVYRSDTETGAYTMREELITDLAWTDGALPAETTYWYTVSAYNSTGESAQSSPLSGATTGVPTVAPETPANLHVTASTSETVSLAWEVVSGAEAYRVYRSDTETGTYVQQVDTVTSQTNWTDSGLSAGRTYWYTVSAYNVAGESLQSSPVSGTTTVIGAPSLYHLDGGSWVQDPAPPNAAVAIAGFSGALYGWVGGTPETVWLLEQSWQQVPVGELSGVVSIAGWGASLFALLDTGTLWYLDGASWQQYHLDAPAGSTAIAAVGATFYALTPTDAHALDGQAWSSVGAPAGAISIAGCGGTLVALSSGGALHHLDGTWRADAPDAPSGSVAIGGVGGTLYVLVR